MTLKIAILMDPIESISFKKDSSLAMMLAAQKRDWTLLYLQQADLFLDQGRVFGKLTKIQVFDNKDNFFEKGGTSIEALDELDVLLMRKDPPFNMNFIYTTYLLEIAETAGLKVINKPASLRDCNEKVFATHFPQCCTPTMVSQNMEQLSQFLEHYPEAIIKPLDGMGGASIFKLEQHGPNTKVILETLTDHGQRPAMIQKYIPEVVKGDKRILLIDGEPVPFALARIPQGDDIRGNLAAGGKGEVQPLNERDYWLCEQLAPSLKAKGLVFVGIDVIGGYLTEINVTSPTCIREIDRDADTDIGGMLMDYIEALVTKR